MLQHTTALHSPSSGSAPGLLGQLRSGCASHNQTNPKTHNSQPWPQLNTSSSCEPVAQGLPSFGAAHSADHESERIIISTPQNKLSRQQDPNVQLHPVRVIYRYQIPRWAILSSSLTSMNSMVLANKSAAKFGSLTLSACTFFQASIPYLQCLEPQELNGQKYAQVLIVRLVSLSEVHAPYCAIEKLSEGKYGLVRLAAGLSVARISEWASQPVVESCMKRKAETLDGEGDSATSWWASSAVRTSLPDFGNSSYGPKRPRLHMGTAISTVVTGNPASSARYGSVNSSPLMGSSLETFSLLDPSSMLVTDYLSAVYLSRSSLAFFAKGPLGRARRQFGASVEPNQGHLHTGGLAAMASLLRRIIMTGKQMDTKFSQTVPAIIGFRGRKPRSKRPNKDEFKRRKDGLLDSEEEMVRKWWNDRQEFQMGIKGDGEAEADGLGLDSGEIPPSVQISKAVSELRTRESLAQIILMLEVLSLEAEIETRKPETTLLSHSSKEQKGGNTELETGKEEKKPKKERKVDLELSLEVLADRLCIWQSVEDAVTSDGRSKSFLLTSPTKQASSTPGSHPAMSSRDSGGNESSGSSTDTLRDFCVDVIIPFYIVRISSFATSIARKFGWVGSPVKRIKPKVRLDPKGVGQAKPGLSKTQSKVDLKHRFDVLKSHSATQRQSSSLSVPVPASGASATGSRGQSQTSLSRASSVVSSSSAVSRFKAREIDLDAMSAATAAKLERRKQVEAELRESRGPGDRASKPSAGLIRSESAKMSGLGIASFGGASQSLTGARHHHSLIADPATKGLKGGLEVHVQATPTKRTRTMEPATSLVEDGLSFSSQARMGLPPSVHSFRPDSPSLSQQCSSQTVPFPTSFSQQASQGYLVSSFVSDNRYQVEPGISVTHGNLSVRHDNEMFVGDTPLTTRTKPIDTDGKVGPVPFALDGGGRGEPSALALRPDQTKSTSMRWAGSPKGVVPDTPSLSACQRRNRKRQNEFDAAGPIAFNITRNVLVETTDYGADKVHFEPAGPRSSPREKENSIPIATSSANVRSNIKLVNKQSLITKGKETIYPPALALTPPLFSSLTDADGGFESADELDRSGEDDEKDIYKTLGWE